MFNSQLEEKVNDLGLDVNMSIGRMDALEAAVRRQNVVQILANRRITNLVINQNATRAAVNELVGIINENSRVGNLLIDKLDEKLNVIGGMFDRTKEAIEAVAAEMGRKIEIVPEVPATVTFTPGEPARVALVKAKRVPRVKPQPVTVEVPKNLLAPTGFVSDLD